MRCVAVEAEADDLLARRRSPGQPLRNARGVLVDHRDRVAAPLEAAGRARCPPGRIPRRRRARISPSDARAAMLPRPRRRIADARLTDRGGSVTARAGWHAVASRSCRAGIGRNRRRGIRQADPGRPAAGHDRDGAPADPEDHRARGLLVRRHLVDRVRDRGDPLRRRGRRVEPRARARHARPDRRSRSRVLLTIVVTSYRQTIFAYPSGGGSYVVSRENLGENPSLVAGASLLVDYILTVAVSISAGVAAIVSIPAFHGPREAPRRCSGSLLIAFISVANLRGIKESGRIFAVPDLHLHRRCLAALVRYGLFRTLRRSTTSRRITARRPTDVRRQHSSAARSASSSCSRASRPARSRSPGSRRSRTACPRSAARSRRTPPPRWCGWGSSSAPCSWACRSSPTTSARTRASSTTVMSQLGTAVFGQRHRHVRGPAVRDRGDPHARREHRVRRLPAAVVDHRPRRLPARASSPTAATGSCSRTACSCSRSPAGVAHHRVRRHHQRADPAVRGRRVPRRSRCRRRAWCATTRRSASRGYKRNIVINAVGAVATFIVLLIVGGTKFTSGAWVPLVVIPLIVAAVQVDQAALHDGRRRACGSRPTTSRGAMNHTVVVLVGGVHRGVLEALAYARVAVARTTSSRCTVVSDEEEQEQHRARSGTSSASTSRSRSSTRPYRELTRPILRYIDELDARWENDIDHRAPPGVRGDATGGATSSTTRARCS